MKEKQLKKKANNYLEVGLPIWDKAAMMERVMNDEDLAGKIIGGFLADLPKQIHLLKSLLRDRDTSGAELRAHSIKNEAASIGGERLRAVASAMEKAARKGDLDSVYYHMTELEVQFENLKETMERDRRND